MSLLLEWSLATTLLLGVALIIDRLALRAAASTRHGHLIIALALVAIWPLLRVVAPEWSAPRVTETWWPGPEASRPVEAARSSVTAPSASAAPEGLPAPTSGSSASSPTRGAVIPAILMLWGAGAILLLVLTIRRYWRAHRLVSLATPIDHVEWMEECGRAARQLGRSRVPRLAASSAIVSPVAWGFGVGTIVLPVQLLGASTGVRYAVMRHEMAHLSRADHLSQLLGTLVAVIHWYNPLAWAVRGRIRCHAEMACDDAVVRGGAHPTWYASELLRLAVRSSARGVVPLPGLFGSGDLEHRIASLTSPATVREGIGTARLLATSLLGVLVTTGAAGIRPPALAASSPSSVPETIGVFAAAPPPTPSGPSTLSRSDPRTWRATQGACPRFIGRRDLVRHCEYRELEFDGESLVLDGGQNGDVTITGAETDRIRVRVVIDAQAADTVLAQALAERIAIDMSNGLRPSIPELGAQEWVGIAFIVEVPRLLPIQVTTWNGAVQLSQLGGPIDVTTLNGMIDIRDVSGRVTGRGNNASYRVALGAGWPMPAHQLVSHNGGIELVVDAPRSVSLDLATTNGRLTVEGISPLPAGCQAGGEGCAGGRLQLQAADGAALEARTVHGNITLRGHAPGATD